VTRKRAEGGGRKKGSKTSDDKRHERYLKDPNREVANDVAIQTWPFMNGGKSSPIGPAIQSVIDSWTRLTRLFIGVELTVERVANGDFRGQHDEQFQREVDAAMRKVRKPNYKQVYNLLRAKRTDMPTYKGYKRGPPNYS
jgi:hypothetical protein